MNRCIFRLFGQNLSAFLRSYTCFNVAHNVLKMERSGAIQKCHKRLVTSDSSKLPSSFSSDDFDLNEDPLHTKVDVKAITNGDPDKLNKLKMLQLEIDLWKLTNSSIPDSLSTENWKELMMMRRNQRKKYLKNLWHKEMWKNAKIQLKLKKKEAFQQFKSMQSQQETVKILTTSSPIEYGLMATTLFYRIHENAINQFDNYRLLQALWFGPHIIIDCSYDSFMSRKNIVKCVTQIMLMWSKNRDNDNPYDIFFCNVDQNGPLWQKLYSMFPNIKELDAPLHYTDQHYLNFFPREKLVYLTPHCTEVLHEYDPNDVYIIGAYSDSGSVEPLSLIKAKKECLRKAKLPLDVYLKWKCGSKSLYIHTDPLKCSVYVVRYARTEKSESQLGCLHHHLSVLMKKLYLSYSARGLIMVMAIMNDLKNGYSWQEALKHVPKGRIEVDGCSDYSEYSRQFRRNVAENIRENYRRNLVYDLLLKQK